MTLNRNVDHDRAATRAVLVRRRSIDDGIKNWLDHQLKDKNGANREAAQIDDMLLTGATMEQIATRIANERTRVNSHFRHLKVDHGLPLVEAGGVWTFDRVKLKVPVATSGKSRQKRHLKQRVFSLPEEVLPAGLTEGAVRTITVNSYERNPEARRQCIVAHGSNCCICGFRFGAVYGPEADGYIHVHHLRQLSEIGSEYEVDAVNDLRPVCPNCHAVLHLGGRCRTIEQIRHLLGQ